MSIASHLHQLFNITGCEPRIARCARTEGSKSVIELTWKFSAAQELLVVATGEGSSSIREWWDQKNAQDSGVQPDTKRR